MRIALVIEKLDPSKGGAEQWTWQFALRLLQRGHDVHVVTTSACPEAQSSELKLTLVAPGKGRLAAAAALSRAARALSVDVVHDMGSGESCDVFQPHGGSRAASEASNLALLPPAMRALKRHVQPWLPRYREFRQLAAKQFVADGRIFIALSNMVARHFREFHAIPSQSMRTIYNGVDTERFTPQLRQRHRSSIRELCNVRNDDVLALLIAHNFRLKGVATLIKATALARRNGVPLRVAVVGAGGSASFQRMAQRLGVAEYVTFPGAMSDPTPWYGAADIYVQPTFYDPCSLVVLEALACGLPVITSRMNGAGELIQDGVEGFASDDPADTEMLARRIEALGDPRTRETMGHAARSLALAHTLDHNCDEIVRVYQERGSAAIAARTDDRLRKAS